MKAQALARTRIAQATPAGALSPQPVSHERRTSSARRICQQALLCLPALGLGLSAAAQSPAGPPGPGAGSPGASARPAAAAPAALSAPRSSSARPSVGCLIGPEQVADIGTPVTGVVALVTVERGDTVKTGQALVQLQDEVERNSLEAARSRAALDADVRSAEAALTLARQRHTRAVGLVAEGFASSQTLEQALAERDVAEQKLLQAKSQRTVNQHELGLVRAQLEQRTLKSPFNGVVIERFISPGERAEDKPLLRVAMLDPLRVELVMPATRWGSVSPGDQVAVLPELPGASTVMARVSHVDKIIDAASNTFRVRMALPNPHNRLPAGARCKVEGMVADAGSPPPGAAPLPAARMAPASAGQPVPLAAESSKAALLPRR